MLVTYHFYVFFADLRSHILALQIAALEVIAKIAANFRSVVSAGGSSSVCLARQAGHCTMMHDT